MDLLALLTEEKVEEFNMRRDAGVRLDFFAADLAGLNLKGVDLTGANLQKADLSNTDLTEAELTQTDFSGADLTETKLNNVSAMRSRWRDAYLGDADLSDADLMGADFTDADFTGAKAPRAIFSGARLKRAIFHKADLSAADLAEARLPDADLSGANFQGAQMREVDLSRAILKGTKLGATDLTRARLSGADLTEADLAGASLTSADLSSAVLTGASVTGTDFTRADFTGATLSGCDLTKANTSEAEIDPAVAGSTRIKDTEIEAGAIHVEDPKIAVNGAKIAAIWENPDGKGKPQIRIAHGRAGGKFSGKLGTVPVPADLAVSSSISPSGEGFVALTVLERPGGTSVHLCDIGRGGAVSNPRSFKLGYTPAVRPMLREVDGGLYLFGIARQGPMICVHKITSEGMEPTLAKHMPTARGFVGGQHPTVLSKGGVLLAVGTHRLGEPMRAPAGFPGRASVACPVDGGLALAWLPTGERGFRFAIARPGSAPEESKVLPKEDISALDAVGNGDGAFVIFTREPAGPGESASAWYAALPGGKPELLLESAGDAYSIHIAAGDAESTPTVGVTSMDGNMEIVALGARGPSTRFSIP